VSAPKTPTGAPASTGGTTDAVSESPEVEESEAAEEEDVGVLIDWGNATSGFGLHEYEEE
jgi:hypothetical protein